MTSQLRACFVASASIRKMRGRHVWCYRDNVIT